jgi:ABC-type antimicrobial peptide transport system permease subunit
MVGLYGVMAFIVAGRRREIGIRMTLGADRRSIAGLVLASSLKLTLIGAGLGAVAALGASRVVQSQLYGVAPTDPPTYAAVVATVAFTAVLATLHPLRQAWRTDPAVTLRAE